MIVPRPLRLCLLSCSFGWRLLLLLKWSAREYPAEHAEELGTGKREQIQVFTGDAARAQQC